MRYEEKEEWIVAAGKWYV